MFCTNCGTEFNGNFCPNCGQAATPSQPPAVQSHDYYDRDGDWIDLSVILGAYRNRAGIVRFFKKCTNYTNEEIEQAADYVMENISPTVCTDYEAAQFRQDVEQSFAKKPRTYNGELCCPECGSTSLSANKRGFGFGKAVAGALAIGSIGLLAGSAGSKKVDITCLACGHRWTV